MRGLERPPRWGIAAIALLLIGNIALLAYLFILRPEPVDPRAHASPPVPQESSEPTAPSPSTADEATADPLILAVYGDGYTSGSNLGGQGPAGWPALVSQRLGMELRLSAVARAGYVAAGVTGETFPQLASANPVPEADVVIVFGSRNDAAGDPAAVEQSATQTLTALRSASTEAQLMIIGPAWSNGTPPPGLVDIGAAVEGAATAGGATYVDPLSQGWFSEPENLIAEDGISPTDAGHAYLADLIAPLIETALGSQAQPPA